MCENTSPACSYDYPLSGFCEYDSNGNFIPYPFPTQHLLSEDQKNVLLDLNSTYSVYICPFTGKPTPAFHPPPTAGGTVIGPSGSVNVRDLWKNSLSSNSIMNNNTNANLFVNDTLDLRKNQVLPSPLKQFKSGIAVQDVKCEHGLQFVIKSEDSSPACVKPATFAKLISMKWGFVPPNELIVEGLEDSYRVYRQIDFTIKFHGTSNPCGYPIIVVKNQNNQTVWKSNFAEILCKALTRPYPYFENQMKFGNSDLGYLRINETGTYTIDTQWYGIEITKQIIEYSPVELGGIPPIQNGTLASNATQKETNNSFSKQVYENSTRNITNVTKVVTNPSDNTRYPVGSYPVYSTPLVGTVNVSTLPPISKVGPWSPNSITPLAIISETPIIHYSNQNITKILDVGMSPNPLKVGDTARFTVTYQNISGKPIYGIAGCGSDLSANILPPSNVKMFYNGITCAQNGDIIQPNQTITDGTFFGYKIIQPGLLNVTLNLDLNEDSEDYSHPIIDTIQFNVNATQ